MTYIGYGVVVVLVAATSYHANENIWFHLAHSFNSILIYFFSARLFRTLCPPSTSAALSSVISLIFCSHPIAHLAVSSRNESIIHFSILLIGLFAVGSSKEFGRILQYQGIINIFLFGLLQSSNYGYIVALFMVFARYVNPFDKSFAISFGATISLASMIYLSDIARFWLWINSPNAQIFNKIINTWFVCIEYFHSIIRFILLGRSFENFDLITLKSICNLPDSYLDYLIVGVVALSFLLQKDIDYAIIVIFISIVFPIGCQAIMSSDEFSVVVAPQELYIPLCVIAVATGTCLSYFASELRIKDDSPSLIRGCFLAAVNLWSRNKLSLSGLKQ